MLTCCLHESELCVIRCDSVLTRTSYDHDKELARPLRDRIECWGSVDFELIVSNLTTGAPRCKNHHIYHVSVCKEHMGARTIEHHIKKV